MRLTWSELLNCNKKFETIYIWLLEFVVCKFTKSAQMFDFAFATNKIVYNLSLDCAICKHNETNYNTQWKTNAPSGPMDSIKRVCRFSMIETKDVGL